MEPLSLFDPQSAVNQRFVEFPDREIIIDMKREDLLHAKVSGNKLRKLKYNLLKAKEQGHDTLLTYGGAFSNHIAATAAAAQIMGFKSIGVIRGEELSKDLEKTLSNNQTLKTAHQKGMQFHFINREDYRIKDTAIQMDKLHEQYGSFYRIPEGGTNELAVLGTQEILTDHDRETYDVIAVAAGTGGTAAGIIKSAALHQKVMVFSALKGDFLKKDIEDMVGDRAFEFYEDTRFGGYARSDNRLIDYMNARFEMSSRFRESGTNKNNIATAIPLDPIYTAKMMYVLEELVKSGAVAAKTRILAVHTGGLQSVHGYNQLLAKKGRNLINYVDEL